MLLIYIFTLGRKRALACVSLRVFLLGHILIRGVFTVMRPRVDFQKCSEYLLLQQLSYFLAINQLGSPALCFLSRCHPQQSIAASVVTLLINLRTFFTTVYTIRALSWYSFPFFAATKIISVDLTMFILLTTSPIYILSLHNLSTFYINFWTFIS